MTALSDYVELSKASSTFAVWRATMKSLFRFLLCSGQWPKEALDGANEAF